MALSHAILAVLTDRTCSGYDLAKQFDGSVGFFWNASHQQIYRELAKLEKLGLINCQTIEQDSRPNKKQYSLTSEGQTNLCDWITTPSPLPPTKDELLVKLFAGHLVSREAILKLLQEQHQLHTKALETYHTIAHDYFEEPDTFSEAGHYQYLTLRNGIHFETSWLAWCDEAIAYLQQHLPS